MYKYPLKKFKLAVNKWKLFPFFFAFITIAFALKKLGTTPAAFETDARLPSLLADNQGKTTTPSEKLKAEPTIPALEVRPTIPLNDHQTKNSKTLITSNKLEIILGENQSEFLFTEDVSLSTHLFYATCAAAKVTTATTFKKMMNLASGLDFDAIEQISITGPLFLQQGERSCSADHAEITTTDTTIILSGNATAKDSMGTVSGNEIRINYATKSIEISGTPNNRPVTLNISDLHQ